MGACGSEKIQEGGDFVTKLDRLENETDEEVIYRICQSKEEIGTWSDVADILNDILGFEYTESKYRKQYQAFEKILNANKKRLFEDDYAKSIEEKKQELYKERQRLSDERCSLNRQLREDARATANYEILLNAVRENGETTLPPLENVVVTDNEEDMIIIVSDLHMGLDVDNNFGRYNSDIAKERLNEYAKQVSVLQTSRKCQNAYVVLLGDMCNGSIHITTRLENRENTILQTQKAAEIISEFVYKLSPYFETIYVNSVAGNHSRIGLKEDVLRDERLDDIIPWYMKAKLEHIETIQFIDSGNIDPTIGDFSVRGNEIVAVHGDYDKFGQSGVAKLTMLLRYIPDIILMGHLHHSEYTNVSDVDVVRCGSLCGACNDYEVTKRIYGRPQQMVLTIGEKGITGFYPIRF